MQVSRSTLRSKDQQPDPVEILMTRLMRLQMGCGFQIGQKQHPTLHLARGDTNEDARNLVLVNASPSPGLKYAALCSCSC